MFTHMKQTQNARLKKYMAPSVETFAMEETAIMSTSGTQTGSTESYETDYGAARRRGTRFED
jgi:hypothetical protein